MRTLGIDVGTLTTEAVIMDEDAVIASSIILSADEAEASARLATEEVLKQAGLTSPDDLYIVATGAGGKAVSFSQQQKAITTCLARGIQHLFPTARMVIDMGAESSTVLKLNERGRVSDWANHDKCASGTGGFLQQMARLMQMPLEEMARLYSQNGARADISNTCAVFAESEVISHVHRVPPTPKEEIVAGIYSSVVSRIMALCKRIGIQPDVAITGGVALNSGLVKTLGQELGYNTLLPQEPQSVAALGAAIVGREKLAQGAG